MDIDLVLANLRKNRFEASYFATKEAAAAYLNKKIDGKVVGLGDSQTLLSLGLYESLGTHNDVRDVAHSPLNAGKTFADTRVST